MKLKRITPRTCLWPLTGSLIGCFALSIGLTFRSNYHCYAGVCGEWLFPLQARLHVVVWYCWISLSVTILALRAFNPSVRLLLQNQILPNRPLGRSITLGGALVGGWILVLYGIITGIWWRRLHQYFDERGHQGGLDSANSLLAAVALTGHYADVTMGMVLLPVARHSALASFFRLSPSSTFAFHMLQAYVLFGMAVLHGLLYAAWTDVYNKFQLTKTIFPLLNPTYLYHEVWPGNTSSLGIWRASLIFSGLAATLIMLAIFITTFPFVRRKHFNVFYFTHLLVILAVVIICLHASTMLYCTAPGLVMWVLDWGMRMYELSGKMESSLTEIGNGWFCLTLPLPRRRLDGCACHSPLAHFHLHHTESSIRELHPFTTITHLASRKRDIPSSTSEKVIHLGQDDETIPIQFLFRKSNSQSSLTTPSDGVRKKKPSTQWTNKLASLVEDMPSGRIQTKALYDDPENLQKEKPARSFGTTLRLEGPYFTPADPSSYETVICLVAGTGISGAIAIAAAFSAQSGSGKKEKATSLGPVMRVESEEEHISHATPQSLIWKRCIVVWSIRETDYTKLPFFEETPGLEVRPHLTGNGRSRLDSEACLKDICQDQSSGKVWVYVSGPNAFIEGGERACRALQVEFFGARWS